jgi:probable HAF family extracellular repeat protein
MRTLTRTLAALPLILAAGASFATEYTYVDLGTLGGNNAVAFGMNDQRQVVGWSSTAGDASNNAFVWTDGVMTDLGRLGGVWAEARAINESGVVVGHFSTTDDTLGMAAFVCENDLATALPTLSDYWSSAHDINADGTIVGTSANSLGHEHAVMWQNGQIVDLGLNSNHERSRAYGINDLGIVTGWEYTPMQGANDAFVTDGAHWLQIGGFGHYQSAEAYDINETGTVVGYTAFPSGDWHGALWHYDGQGGYLDPIDMGLLPGTEQGEAYDLNEAGDAVGSCQTFTFPEVTYTAFAYLDGVLIDLRDLLPDGVDVELIEARDINNHGDIVGTAHVNGYLRAFMLQVQTGCAADLDGDGDTDQADLGTLLGSYGVDSDGDLDGDGDTDQADLGALLADYGCTP